MDIKLNKIRVFEIRDRIEIEISWSNNWSNCVSIPNNCTPNDLLNRLHCLQQMIVNDDKLL